mmetsp:Transcript_67993/g.221310  ORF Transcript_67993/g.221310 Transcript_67993/m.221310 type:complete len:93 (-) Transcript_67993:145-423(-)
MFFIFPLRGAQSLPVVQARGLDKLAMHVDGMPVKGGIFVKQGGRQFGLWLFMDRKGKRYDLLRIESPIAEIADVLRTASRAKPDALKGSWCY